VGADWENPVKNKAKVRRVVKEALRKEHRMKRRDSFMDGLILAMIDLTAILPMQSVPSQTLNQAPGTVSFW
jgi:hypothetical protein